MSAYRQRAPRRQLVIGNKRRYPAPPAPEQDDNPGLWVIAAYALVLVGIVVLIGLLVG